MTSSRLYWIGFNLVKGIGAARLRGLLDFFGDISSAWQAPVDELQVAGLSPRLANSVVQARREVDLESLWQRIESQGVMVLTWEDEAYPARLKEIDQPPPVLYLKGSLVPEDEWAVAIVGTRRMTAYGRQAAEELAGLLARNRVTVVSGLARGVDAAAHQAALNAGGRTLAVLGSGVDNIYPPEHRRMAETIRSQGAVISDYPLGTNPDAANFPPRNRIISGLARSVVVIEAGETSGALITASFAVDQGREVFALPGGIYAPQSKGTNQLIQRGARPLLDFNEILADLDLSLAQEHRSARTALPADATEAQLFAILGSEPMHVDEIQRAANLPVDRVSAALVIMELKGLVRQVGGMNYVAVREAGGEYSTE